MGDEENTSGSLFDNPRGMYEHVHKLTFIFFNFEKFRKF